MRTRSLDSLLEGSEPAATFHDASLISVNVDYIRRRWVAEFSLYGGDEGTRKRNGRLTIEGLKLWAIEPPAPFSPGGVDGLSLTDDGFLGEAPTDTGKALATGIGEFGVGWWLFFSDLNAFAFVAGETATFVWAPQQDSASPATRAAGLDATQTLAEAVNWFAEWTSSPPRFGPATKRLSEMIDVEPEAAWDFISFLVEHAPDDAALEWIGAGPLEDLMCNHGELLIDRAEQAAASNPRFKKCLGHVWGQSRMGEATQRRIRRAAGQT